MKLAIFRTLTPLLLASLLGAALAPAWSDSYILSQGQETKPPQGAPATQGPKRALKVEDYAQWESLGAAAISPDGHWFAYTVNKVDMDGYLVVKNCDAPQQALTPLGTGPRFSDDSKWVAYSIQVAKKDAEALREQKKPVENKLALRELATGAERILEGVQSWEFTKGGGYLVALRYRPATRQTGGSDLSIFDLKAGSALTIGNVVSFNIHKDGGLMAVGIDSGGDQKGVQVYDFALGRLRDVRFQKGNLGLISWAEKAPILTFLAGTTDPKKEGAANVIYRATGFDKPAITVASFDPAADSRFPKGFRIAEFAALQQNEKGDIVAFGIKEWEDKKEDKAKPEEKPNVDVWHYKDYDLQPYQQRVLEQTKRETYLCLWRPETNTFTQIGSPEVKSVRLIGNFQTALWENTEPYEDPTRPGGIEYSDWYVVDTLTGHRTRFLEKRQFGPTPSPEGKFLAYYAQKAWWVYDVAADKARNLTQGIKRDFWDTDDDHTIKEKPAASFPVWLNDDAGLIVGDKYDKWLFDPAAGKATQLTDGKDDHVEFQVVNPGFSDEGLRITDPLYLRAFDEKTKKSGYLRFDPGAKEGKMLVLDDSSLGQLRRAKDVDRMIFTMQSFEKSPSWQLTNEQFSAIKPLARTNPQQAEFLWGKAELVDFKSKWGKELQGILYFPAGHEAGKSYPMITYIYEQLSDGFHNYAMPSPWGSYNMQHWIQQGYFVFMPDIAYRDRQPGVSAVQCLEPAVQAVLSKKVGVDPAKVGLVGHSWGGYQTAFVPTQSNVFAAAVAGAPLTELITMYNSFYWNAGITDQVIFESSQGRMEVPWYEDIKAYTDNSPMWNAKNLNTPMMIAFGDSDGAVDWHQGQQFYNTLRRMGKQIIMLVYPGENHGLAKRPNQLDYAHRVRHFFDVYLKGAKPEKWVTSGVPAVQKGKEGG
ncbi:MAG: S9 family peptidase [Armatimonadetes bacterium]|nr:S9 family peptidase [Armatimonadota bacterium]